MNLPWQPTDPTDFMRASLEAVSFTKEEASYLTPLPSGTNFHPIRVPAPLPNQPAAKFYRWGTAD